MTRWIAVLAALAGIAAVAVVGTDDRPAPAATGGPHSSVLGVRSTSLVCVDSHGTATAPVGLAIAGLSALGGGPALSVTSRPLDAGGKPTQLAPKPVLRTSTSGSNPATVLTATGPGAAGLAADEIQLLPTGIARSLTDSACERPGTDWWLAGTDGRVGFTASLVLANPGGTAAQVTVTAWSANGTLRPPRLQALSVPARSTVSVPVADVVPDAATVTLHVQANTGRVTAHLIEHWRSGVLSAGGDWIPPTNGPADSAVVAGWPAAAEASVLFLTNPGRADVTVSLKLATTGGEFAPAGHPSMVVRAGHTATVDLTQSLAGTAGAVVLRSTGPVVAAGLVRARISGRPLSDLAWLPATAPVGATSVGWADDHPPFDRLLRLQLTAPRSAASVRLTSTVHSVVVHIPAGRTVDVTPSTLLGASAYGPLRLTLLDGGPVYASRELYALGAHGPLLSTEPPTVIPAPETVPAVRPDLRAGLR